jgi:hypothetical protein
MGMSSEKKRTQMKTYGTQAVDYQSGSPYSNNDIEQLQMKRIVSWEV